MQLEDTAPTREHALLRQQTLGRQKVERIKSWLYLPWGNDLADQAIRTCEQLGWHNTIYTCLDDRLFTLEVVVDMPGKEVSGSSTDRDLSVCFDLLGLGFAPRVRYGAGPVMVERQPTKSYFAVETPDEITVEWADELLDRTLLDTWAPQIEPEFEDETPRVYRVIQVDWLAPWDYRVAASLLRAYVDRIRPHRREWWYSSLLDFYAPVGGRLLEFSLLHSDDVD